MRRTNRTLMLCGAALCCALASCENLYTYEYYVANLADTAVVVHMVRRATTGLAARDTTFVLGREDVAKVYTTTHGVEGRKGPFTREVKYDIDSCTITKRGVVTTRDFTKDERWQFQKVNHTGNYTAVITNDDF